jgi:hypothetical protein
MKKLAIIGASSYGKVIADIGCYMCDMDIVEDES